MAHAGGRPPIYAGEETVKKAEAYLESCIDEEYSRIKSEGDKSTSFDNYIRVKLPSIAGLALYLGVSRDTIYDWKSKYLEFSDIIEKILAKQEEKLIEGGLSGTYNASIAKVILTKHGYRDAQEVTGKDGGPIETKSDNPALELLAKEYEQKLKQQLGI